MQMFFSFKWDELIAFQMKQAGRLFDIVIMDPPYNVGSKHSGLKIGYKKLKTWQIQALPIPKLQDNGFLFVWTVNQYLPDTLQMISIWGYTLWKQIVWIKICNHSKKLKTTPGRYFSHATEKCLVAYKGNCDLNIQLPEVIEAKVTGQSEKPLEMYAMIEQCWPMGFYLEIFGRKRNVRNKWITIGNEL